MKFLIKDASIVNEGRIFSGSILVENGLIAEVFEGDGSNYKDENTEIISAGGKCLIPGLIDDQVHFREPGLTHKGNIYTESRAAVAGGITSFMEMPNTNPQTTTVELLEEKFNIGAKDSLANYSFFIGATNDNVSQLLAADPAITAGIKIFMGSSTGNMLVDNHAVLNEIFSKAKMLIATHCEDEQTIKDNLAAYKAKFGDNIPFDVHHLIRSEEACYKSSSFAVELAKKHNTRLHILHISTASEVALFENNVPLAQKRITAEACTHHLWFSNDDYKEKGAWIKWNPAVKTAKDRDAIWKGLLDNNIDILATDHAPHTIEEKQQGYLKAPSGGPLVQHALPAMMQMVKQGRISLEHAIEKLCHAPAVCFSIDRRGFIRKGYHADLVMLDMNDPWTVDKSNILYKCGWSPFEGVTFDAKVSATWVNGTLVYKNGSVIENRAAQQIRYNR
ncbi:MAG: dihydroorotase [Flavobacteriales bacterium]